MAEDESTVTDASNPFYCPSLPASVFLDSIRRKIRHSDQGISDDSLDRTPELTNSSNEEIFPSFTQLLDQSLCDEDLLELLYQPDERLLDSSGDNCNSSLASTCPRRPRGGPSMLDRDGVFTLGQTLARSSTDSPRLSHGFSDFALPARREMSVVDVNNSSFELSAKAEKLRYFVQKMPLSPEESPARKRYIPGDCKSIKSRDGLIARIRALEGIVLPFI